MEARVDQASVGPPQDQTPFILSLGSNLGDRLAHLRGGVEFLRRRVTVEALSKVVESAPWGPLPQPPFLNLLLRGRTERSPASLLSVANEAESRAGRVRTETRWGPRTLDVDLIFFGDMRLRSVRLQIPHPRWQERPFVWWLLRDVASGMIDPTSGAALSSRTSRAVDSAPPAGVTVLGELPTGSEGGAP